MSARKLTGAVITAGGKKPRRETKKPATYVPGATPTITKKTRAASKPTPTTRTTRQSTPKKTPKTAPKKTPKAAPKKTATVKRATTKRAPQSGAKASPSAPKRVVTKKTAAQRAAARGQPKYVEMIVEGIKAMRKKNGSSRQAIEKYVEENYPQRPDSKKWVRITLQKLTKDGIIEKNRASYKLPPKNKTVVATPAKPATPSKPKAVKKAPRVAKAKKTKTTKATKKTAATVSKTSVDSSVPVETSPPKPIWQFNHNGWKNYAPDASDLVEVQYQEWLQNNQMFDVRSVKSGTWEYNVDFRRMVQINIQHPDHTERQIRRHIE